MCGIVAATARRDVAGILLEGLKRLEYRGYDSAGMAVLSAHNTIGVYRRPGKVINLETMLQSHPLPGACGVAHTRWATHGKPEERNAHPHSSGSDVTLVHNGIIENYETLRAQLKQQGYVFSSDTDTEVIVHLVHAEKQKGLSLLDAVRNTLQKLDGAYAIAVISADEPGVIVGARKGSPLVLGMGIGEHFLASDPLALRQVTDSVIYLEEGDLVAITADGVYIEDHQGNDAKRQVTRLREGQVSAEKGEYRHYMLKEIFEQPDVIRATLEERIGQKQVLSNILGPEGAALLARTRQVHIVACGTSYHTGLIARYWIEQLAGVPCQVEVASEYRYRTVVVPENTLFVTVSQSGETADTLAALRFAKTAGYLATVAIVNVPESSLCRESDLVLMTRAGPEIGVASTKAFTTQLIAFLLLTILLARQQGRLPATREATLVEGLRALPAVIEQTLQLDARIKVLSEQFTEKHHALFLGRGVQYPVALEGALKLKEISYIHAEAYPAGELKHGPLALVDSEMPVIAVAPNDQLLEKLRSNLQEVHARGGQLFVFADARAHMGEESDMHIMPVPHVDETLAPVVYTIPLQLLAYHVAVGKGTDVDQPRNLAKSVTVE
ncbi:MAG: glutamine--fructose-6-phosphate transaminase (isomerizing) [Gammaproteobacteria bacterium]|nr:MAG: glutamine--fructose-6-phosphate transaminase (isomerizing) [Gammaproteobacteria bacterium]